MKNRRIVMCILSFCVLFFQFILISSNNKLKIKSMENKEIEKEIKVESKRNIKDEFNTLNYIEGIVVDELNILDDGTLNGKVRISGDKEIVFNAMKALKDYKVENYEIDYKDRIINVLLNIKME